MATPPDYVLRLDWLVAPADGRTVLAENSGVFVRFPHPDGEGYHNPAWVPVHRGFEVQIDPQGLGPQGEPDVPSARTGAIYELVGPDVRPDAPAGRWNQFEIRVEGPRYQVKTNGSPTSDFTFQGEDRGSPSTPDRPSFVGLQVYAGAKAAFRGVRIRPL